MTRDTDRGGWPADSYLPGAGPPPGGHPARSRKNRLLVGACALAAAVIAAVAVILATASPSPTHTGALSSTHASSPQATHASSPTQSAVPSLSASPVASVRHLSAQQMRPGDCLTGSNLGLNNNNPWPASVEAVPGSQKHLAEVYYSANYWAGDKTYPGASSISNQAIAQCKQVFAGYVGIPASSSQYSAVDLYPESADWSSGDRSLQCIAYYSTNANPGGAPLYGSIRGSDK